MPIQATCGHLLAEYDGPHGMGNAVSLRAWARDGSRAVSYRTVCNACKKAYVEEGVVFHDSNEEEAWLSGRGPSNQPAV